MFPPDTAVTLEMFVKNVSPECEYECVFKVSDGTVLKSAAEVKLNFQSIDVKGRGHRHVVMCGLLGQPPNSKFQIGLESNGHTDWYHTELSFENQITMSKESTKALVEQYSVDGNKFQPASEQLLVARRTYYTLHFLLSAPESLPSEPFCVFEASNSRAMTNFYQVNL